MISRASKQVLCALAVCALAATSTHAAERWTSEFVTNYGGWSLDRHARLIGDIDGDGLDDLVGFYDWGVIAALSTGRAFTPSTLWTVLFSNDGGWTNDHALRTLGDVDGDGRDDIIGWGLSEVQFALSEGDRFGPAQMGLWGEFGHHQGWRSGQHARRVGDVNGDGRDDLVAFGEQAVYVALSNGSGFEPGQVWSQAMTTAPGGAYDPARHVRLVGDVDGDGRADAVSFGEQGVTVMFSEGGHFGPETLVLADLGAAQRGDLATTPRAVADVDGDGRADLVAFTPDGVVARLSEGRTFGDRQVGLSAYGGSHGYGSHHPRLMGDFDGNGKADIAGFPDDAVRVALSTGAGFDNRLVPLSGGDFVTRLTQEFGGLCLTNILMLAVPMPCDLDLPRGWVLEARPNGTYLVMQRGWCLLAEHGGRARELVWSGTCGGAGSEWYVERTRGGRVRLRNARSTQCLQGIGGGVDAGVPVHTAPCSADDRQLWQVALRPRVIQASLSAMHSGKCLSISGFDAVQATCNPHDARQHFTLVDNGDGAFTVRDHAVGGCLAPRGDWRLAAHPCVAGSKAMQYALQPADDGGFLIVSHGTGRCFDVAHRGQHDGADVLSWGCHGDSNQRWTIERAQTREELQISLQNIGGVGGTALVIGGEDSGLLTRDPVAIVAFLRRSGAAVELGDLHDLLTFEQRVEFEARVGSWDAELPADITVSAQAIVVSADAMVSLTGASAGVEYTTVQMQVELGGAGYGEVKVLSADARISVGLDGVDFGPSANVWTGSAGFGDPDGTHAGISTGVGTEGFRTGARWGQNGQYGVTVPLAFVAVDLYVTDDDVMTAALFAADISAGLGESAVEAFSSAYGWAEGAYETALDGIGDAADAIGDLVDDVGSWFSGWW